MKNLVFGLFLALCLVHNCDGQNVKNIKISDETLKAFGLSQEFLTAWRTDSSGCLGEREKYIRYILQNKKLIGISYQGFIDIFGLPIKKLGETGIEYYAFTDCDETGKPSPNPDNLGYLEFYFKDGKLDACIFSEGQPLLARALGTLLKKRIWQPYSGTRFKAYATPSLPVSFKEQGFVLRVTLSLIYSFSIIKHLSYIKQLPAAVAIIAAL